MPTVVPGDLLMTTLSRSGGNTNLMGSSAPRRRSQHSRLVRRGTCLPSLSEQCQQSLLPPTCALVADDLLPISLYNVVDSTVGIVPVTVVDPILDAVTDAYRTLDLPGSSMVESRVYDGPHAVYNSVDMAGLPCGVQVVGPRYAEEKVLELMRVVDDALGERMFGPGTFAKKQLALDA